jgi:AcrR family transcriptional regulator
MAKITSRRSRDDHRDTRGEERRRLIFKSLHDCILSQGYIKTTLADIAKGAGMYPSHLLYYFNGKEAILEQYFENVSESFLEKIDSFSTQETREQIQSLTDFWFKGEKSTVKEIGFMLECFGAAVNDETLKITKREFDRRCKDYLEQIFSACPLAFISSNKDAAEIAYSLMIGLRSAVYFDSAIDQDDAHRLFLNTILTMSGLK